VTSPRQILVYGPPAAGKLTVANELASRFEVAVVDNHASIDPALRLFTFGTPEFAALVEEIRVALIRAAARARRDIVTTLVYARGFDDDHVRRLIEATTSEGGIVHLVQLRPRDEILENRVSQASRSTTSKISDVEALRELLHTHDLTTRINADDLTIDNSDLTPAAVATLIGTNFGLRSRA
jgi:cytidylate kinase